MHNEEWVTMDDNQLLDESEPPMKRDPWANRASGMACKTCIWFAPKMTMMPGTIDTPNPVYHLGRCRRHAPTISGYPVVFVNDWCGDHRIDENKL
jgi:hypothetical protein